MRTRRWRPAWIGVALAALWLPNCRTATPPAATASKVILLSYDGMGADDLQRRLQDGTLGTAGFRRMAAEGTLARVIPVNPTLTASAHISIATGATPQRTGIVSNTFHLPGTPRTQSASGFSVPIETETLWEAAKRQGKAVGVITFPGVDGNGPRRTGDWGLVYTSPVAQSRIIYLKRSDFEPHTPREGSPPSYSPVLRASVRWDFAPAGKSISRDVHVLVFDTTNDSFENYDGLRLELGSRKVHPDERRWFAISQEIVDPDGPALYGSWSKLLEFDPQLSRVVFYWGAISRNRGYPAAYQQMIDREIGFWPGPPDEDQAEEWLTKREGIDPETFIEQVQRFSEFFTAVTLLSMRRMSWNLILAYQPIIDESEHQFRIVDERQQGSNAENRAAGERVRRAAYQTADSSVARILEAAGRDAAVVATADHGLAALDTSIRLNRLLVQWGFAQSEKGRLAANTRWAAFTSGNLAHLYGFEPQSMSEADDLVQRLRELRSPDGDAVFERVSLRSEGDHPNSGDIIAYAYPRFSFSSGTEGEVFAKTSHFGQHGGLNHHREFHTVLLASGSNVPRVRWREMQQIQIAAFVCSLLGINPPMQAQPY